MTIGNTSQNQILSSSISCKQRQLLQNFFLTTSYFLYSFDPKHILCGLSCLVQILGVLTGEGRVFFHWVRAFTGFLDIMTHKSTFSIPITSFLSTFYRLYCFWFTSSTLISFSSLSVTVSLFVSSPTIF